MPVAISVPNGGYPDSLSDSLCILFSDEYHLYIVNAPQYNMHWFAYCWEL